VEMPAEEEKPKARRGARKTRAAAEEKKESE
jgi:hypothetical protein